MNSFSWFRRYFNLARSLSLRELIMLILAGLTFFLYPAASSAMAFGADFSATAVQTIAGQTPQAAKIYLSAGRARSEMERDGLTIVEIRDSLTQQVYLLFPSERVYIQRPMTDLSLPFISVAGPCSELAANLCIELGERQRHGRSERGWRYGQHVSEMSDYWFDNESGFLTQLVRGDKVVTEMEYLGTEVVDDRKSEKWLTRNGDGTTRLQWYDPVLRIAIMEESGSVKRKLTDIVVEPQPASIFILPTGIKRLELPLPVR
jgi:hypothetical protein